MPSTFSIEDLRVSSIFNTRSRGIMPYPKKIRYKKLKTVTKNIVRKPEAQSAPDVLTMTFLYLDGAEKIPYQFKTMYMALQRHIV